MDALIEALTRIPSRPLGTVVHIGAGSAALEQHEALVANRLVLVEGDPDIVSDLRSGASRLSRAVDIVGQPVAPAAGPLLWHRYNLRMLNGPLDASTLGRFYPRLRQASALPLHALAFGELLGQLDLSHDDTHEDQPPNVLLLDVPGQEDALLASLSEAELRNFGWITLRGCSEAHAEGWCTAEQGGSRLGRSFFQPVDTGSDTDVLWPVTLYRFDDLGFERHLLTQSLVAAEARVHALDLHSQAMQAERDAFAVQLRTTAAELERLTKERDEHAHWHQENAKWAQSLKAENEGLRAELAAVRSSAEALGKQLADSDAARTAVLQQMADRDTRQHLLDAEVLKAEAQLELIKDVLLREKNF